MKSSDDAENARIEHVACVELRPSILSATDWAEGEEKDEKTGEWKQWGIEQSIFLVGELQVSWWKTRVVQKMLSRGAALISSRSFFVPRFKKLGVDLIDTSSRGNYNKQKIPLGPSYQVPFASAIKKAFPTLPIGAVGLLTTATQIENVLQSGKADGEHSIFPSSFDSFLQLTVLNFLLSQSRSSLENF